MEAVHSYLEAARSPWQDTDLGIHNLLPARVVRTLDRGGEAALLSAHSLWRLLISCRARWLAPLAHADGSYRGDKASTAPQTPALPRIPTLICPV